jgi:hypothetical protein
VGSVPRPFGRSFAREHPHVGAVRFENQPLEQSQRFRERAAAVGHDVMLVVRYGGAHGWLTMPLDVRRFAAWFDAHLADPRRR